MALDVLKMLTSIHGRRLGLTSSGGIKGKNDAVAQEWGTDMIQDATSTATALRNDGTSILSSSSTAPAYSILAPVKGVRKEIYCAATSSDLTINATAASITFGSTGGDTLNFDGAAGTLRSNCVVLRGLSTTQWGIIGKTSTAIVTVSGG